ncbi:MAG TPA: TlyA family RNA methyltransferase [Bacteriovoracaceae bacterium]|nr:TlyA family RNA methyltransferase [Bacteriovoracaceae bacterium]
MKERADKVMADLGLVTSRSQAKSLIEKGDVTVNGNILKKAAEMIDHDAKIEISSTLFVGRGAFKLEKALQEFKVDPKGLICLDVGASTGGFTEVLLLGGAARVYAIDVGHSQLAPKLALDPRVINMENTNIRELSNLPELADLAVMDLSFISITKVLAQVSALLKADGELIVLIKPQFEIGRELLPKDGVVKDPASRQKVLDDVNQYARNNGWKVLKTIQSPIEGKNGNVEYLSYLVKYQNHNERSGN